VAGLIALPPATASATTRYATPGGSTSDPACPATAPCALQHAVGVAQAGDDVQLAPRDYSLGSDLSCSGALEVDHLYVHGVIGRPRPRILAGSDACVGVVLNNQGAMSDLEVDAASGTHALEINAFARAFRVVTGGNDGAVWVQRGGLLLDS